MILKAMCWIFLLMSTFLGCTKKPSGYEALYVDRNFTFPAGFPPDPGEAGKKELGGFDVDQDGLRDDVQRWIYARFPSDETKRKSLRQMALVYQDDLNHDYTEQDIDLLNDKLDKAIACLGGVFPGDVEGYVEMGFVKAKMLNTVKRTVKFLEADKLFDGKTLHTIYRFGRAACE